jgi:hypothetical protein
LFIDEAGDRSMSAGRKCNIVLSCTFDYFPVYYLTNIITLTVTGYLLFGFYQALWSSKKNRSVFAAVGVAKCSVHELNAAIAMDKSLLALRPYKVVRKLYTLP